MRHKRGSPCRYPLSAWTVVGLRWCLLALSEMRINNLRGPDANIAA